MTASGTDHNADTPNTPDTPEGLDALAAEYVLGTLSASAHEAVLARLPTDPALRLAVREWEARLLPLTRLATPQEPSQALWARIAQTLQAQPAAAAAPHIAATPSARSGFTRWWDSLRLWRLATGGGFVLAALLASVVLRHATQEPLPRHVVVLVAPQDKSPGWLVQSSSGSRLQLIPLGPTAVPAGRTLQFWTKADPWAGPVSLGLVAPNQPLEVGLDQLPPLEPNQLFELTLEPEGGSPLNRPTGPILFIGRSVQVL